MKCKTIFCEIKDQLLSSGALLLSQREYLISAITLIEAGEPLDAAFSKAELPPRPRGKCSVGYQAAIEKRNALLKMAADYLPGTEWAKCKQLAELCATAWRLSSAGKFTPVTEPEKIIQRIINAGTRLPMTTPSVFSAVFKKN